MLPHEPTYSASVARDLAELTTKYLSLHLPLVRTSQAFTALSPSQVAYMEFVFDAAVSSRWQSAHYQSSSSELSVDVVIPPLHALPKAERHDAMHAWHPRIKNLGHARKLTCR
ncbi:hypothetical protein IG631_05405 [Alternaria alternata]|nr:hypothetical protein IG631_05405 [Alternaria alternata]